MKKISIAALLICLMCASMLVAQSNSPRWLVVTGQSDTAVVPDVLTFMVSLVSQDKDLDAAKQDSDLKYAKLQSILDLMSISKDDLEEIYFSFTPIYEYKDQGRSKLMGYRINRQVKITLNKLDQYETIMGTLISTDVDAISRYEFINSKRAEIMQKLRVEALQKAKNIAQGMAEVYGMKIGKPLEITEGAIRHLESIFDSEYGNAASAVTKSVVAETAVLGKAKLSAAVTVKFELAE